MRRVSLAAVAAVAALLFLFVPRFQQHTIASVWKARKEHASIGLLQINGTKDTVVSLEKPNNAAPAIYDVIEYWKKANGLDRMEKEQLSELAMAYRYFGTGAKAQVWYIEVGNGRHS